MDIDAIPMLLAFFWIGFSLPYALLSWLSRVKPQFTIIATHFPLLPPRISYPVRLALAVIGIVGCLGAAGLIGELRGRVVGIDAALLVGLVVGVLIAYELHFRRKHAP
jgi:hypothetical protein